MKPGFGKVGVNRFDAFESIRSFPPFLVILLVFFFRVVVWMLAPYFGRFIHCLVINFQGIGNYWEGADTRADYIIVCVWAK